MPEHVSRRRFLAATAGAAAVSGLTTAAPARAGRAATGEKLAVQGT